MAQSMGPRAGRKVLTLVRRGETRDANAQGVGLRCEAEDRMGIEQFARYIMRPAISNGHILA